MLPLCPGSAMPAHTSTDLSNHRARRQRTRRALLAALLLGLMFLPIFLEVTAAAEGSSDKASALLTSRKTLDFGIRPVGGQTPGVTLAIANNGEKNLAISKVSLAGEHKDDFTVISSTCDSLAPKGMCEIVARFAPKAVGERTARLVVSAGGNGESLEVPMIGKGIDRSTGRRSRRSYR